MAKKPSTQAARVRFGNVKIFDMTAMMGVTVDVSSKKCDTQEDDDINGPVGYLK